MLQLDIGRSSKPNDRSSDPNDPMRETGLLDWPPGEPGRVIMWLDGAWVIDGK
jgi:hypothetical protein